MMPNPNDQQLPDDVIPPEREKFQDLITSFGREVVDERNPQLPWSARLMHRINVCHAAIEMLRGYEPDRKLDEVVEALEAQVPPPVAFSAAGPWREGGNVVRLESVGDVEDLPPEANWVEGFRLREETNARLVYYQLGRIKAGLVNLLVKHRIIPLKTDDLI